METGDDAKEEMPMEGCSLSDVDAARGAENAGARTTADAEPGRGEG